ncbi:MAG: hypothetical protein AABN95_09875 [Acidobacteriota bacterium]
MKLTNRKFTLPALFFTATISVAMAFGANDATPEMESSPKTETVRSLAVKESPSTPFVTTPTAEDQSEAGVALLTIRPTGFEPNEISIPAGKYLIVVRNRTGLAQFSLRVDRGTGVRLYDVRLPRYKRDWKQIVQLTPDTYVITETNHPGWVCRITVTAT